jgi:hypothetical protein
MPEEAKYYKVKNVYRELKQITVSYYVLIPGGAIVKYGASTYFDRIITNCKDMESYVQKLRVLELMSDESRPYPPKPYIIYEEITEAEFKKMCDYFDKLELVEKLGK